jgi:hypothetical protein
VEEISHIYLDTVVISFPKLAHNWAYLMGRMAVGNSMATETYQ